MLGKHEYSYSYKCRNSPNFETKGQRLRLMSASSFASRYVKASRRSLALLDRCLTMSQIKQMQSHLIVSATLLDPYAAGRIISFCAVSADADLSHAYNLFLSLEHRTTFIWNTIIRAFVERNANATAISLYKNMLQSGFLPNNYTFSFVLRACTTYSSTALASHALVIKLGWESYDFVLNGLIHLYANLSLMDAARKLFNVSTNRDVITWTSLINGYLKSGHAEFARELFDQMPARNAVSWSAMITGYVQMGMFREALGLFNDMQLSGLRPNHAGIVGALTACAFLGALDHGRWIHAYVDRNGMELDRVLGTALVDMYAKCGCIEMACSVFYMMPYKDVFAFTSLISGLANHDQSVRAIELFARMQREGVVPNEVTFICVLSACSRMGLVDEGLRIFNCMSKVYGIEPGVQHYGCLVDLLGKAGLLEEANKLVKQMPMEPDSYVLGALLNSCRMRGDVELGKETVESLVERGLDHGGVHVLLSNMFASSNQWDWVVKVRKEMGEKKVRKVPGCSLIEIDGRLCEFIVGDRSYLLMEEVMLILLGIDNHLKFLWLDDDSTNCSMTSY
ncbi:pentatricopeptide repeat-containing protein At5g66520-like [Herrania umbratica]|uniref:Pentatricopeptide repeat-containing protein At5g66520-like n=1 Tax=Herrania umbratica TaxID=108875 RepID=A0A6J0ZRX9_9ROSI|nr:pentatricopeptide repeat-containing protein At5g66520-like [Herrania umbratica]XP_021277550.1 pentatricopeptide repeat-containing protein At5g66520-like [Herrania umbratica]XP_021277551.1 pentatricopeptide repeat-containing protein At5g66520-like [Herrania umbratica]XP_021277553.1 pentatricopeptide repeat-containing protein At5g66520-like [Herrania umbratica]XP_021277554.1 pentatricopeptide repeat-containing protein At5g66520-like [Herrania umbratica]XP_021277555.1 pentatricopeptide repeat-